MAGDVAPTQAAILATDLLSAVDAALMTPIRNHKLIPLQLLLEEKI